MTMLLHQGTEPDGLEVKTHGPWAQAGVRIGDYRLSLKDFLCVAEYVLTNTDLESHDPRLQFVERVKALTVCSGYNSGGQRLQPKLLPVT